MSLLCYLEDLKVINYRSVEVLFNLGCVNEIEGNSNLKGIEVCDLKKLKEVWSVKGVNNSNFSIHGFQALKSLKIKNCWSFRNLFTPTTANFDLGALMSISMLNVGKKSETAMINLEQVVKDKYDEEILEVIEKVPNVAISPQVMFQVEIEGAASSGDLRDNHQALLLPSLKHIELEEVEEMRHVWKCCNWNKFFILQQPPNSSFHELKDISMSNCKSIKYLFSSFMFKLLFNLKDVKIDYCDSIEEVVSNRDVEDNEMNCTSISTHMSSTLFPLLDALILTYLKSLWHIGGADGSATSQTTISSNNMIVTTSMDYEPQHTQVDVLCGHYANTQEG